METIRRYNYRAYPTKGQREALSRLFGACRYAWNWYLDQRKVAWWLHRGNRLRGAAHGRYRLLIAIKPLRVTLF